MLPNTSWKILNDWNKNFRAYFLCVALIIYKYIWQILQNFAKFCKLGLLNLHEKFVWCIDEQK